MLHGVYDLHCDTTRITSLDPPLESDFCPRPPGRAETTYTSTNLTNVSRTIDEITS